MHSCSREREHDSTCSHRTGMGAASGRTWWMSTAAGRNLRRAARSWTPVNRPHLFCQRAAKLGRVSREPGEPPHSIASRAAGPREPGLPAACSQLLPGTARWLARQSAGDGPNLSASRGARRPLGPCRSVRVSVGGTGGARLLAGCGRQRKTNLILRRQVSWPVTLAQHDMSWTSRRPVQLSGISPSKRLKYCR